MLRFLFIGDSLSLFSCASYFKRQECEDNNWFEHGEQIALQGRWLKSDGFVSECRKAEAEISEGHLDQGFKSGREKYCTSDNALRLGRKGGILTPGFCDGPSSAAVVKSYSHRVGLGNLESRLTSAESQLGYANNLLALTDEKSNPLLKSTLTNQKNEVERQVADLRSERQSALIIRDQLEEKKTKILDTIKALQVELDKLK